MLPLLASLPFLNYLDKSSLSFASIMGIIEDLVSCSLSGMLLQSADMIIWL